MNVLPAPVAPVERDLHAVDIRTHLVVRETDPMLSDVDVVIGVVGVGRFKVTGREPRLQSAVKLLIMKPSKVTSVPPGAVIVISSFDPRGCRRVRSRGR